MRSWNAPRPINPERMQKIVRISERIKEAVELHCKIGHVIPKIFGRECIRGHIWLGKDDVCPFCCPDQKRLSEFGIVGKK